VRVGDETVGRGEGRSKGEAEQAAAEVAWARLSNEPEPAAAEERACADEDE
jgi:dsRNA-specific ribonuclease